VGRHNFGLTLLLLRAGATVQPRDERLLGQMAVRELVPDSWRGSWSLVPGSATADSFIARADLRSKRFAVEMAAIMQLAGRQRMLLARHRLSFAAGLGIGGPAPTLWAWPVWG
jgi:hypothetical protein